MYLTLHASTAFIIGSQTRNLPLAFILSYLLHIILDAIPHGDQIFDPLFASNESLKRKSKIYYPYMLTATIDVLLVTGIIIFFLPRVENVLSTGVAILGGILPDLIFGAFRITRFSFLKKISLPHRFFHKLSLKANIPFGLGLALQLIISALILRIYW